LYTSERLPGSSNALLDGELDELVPQCRAIDLDPRNRDWQLEPSGTRTSWIEKEHTTTRFC
jgi:hypothetical protein